MGKLLFLVVMTILLLFTIAKMERKFAGREQCILKLNYKQSQVILQSLHQTCPHRKQSACSKLMFSTNSKVLCGCYQTWDGLGQNTLAPRPEAEPEGATDYTMSIVCYL